MLPVFIGAKLVSWIRRSQHAHNIVGKERRSLMTAAEIVQSAVCCSSARTDLKIGALCHEYPGSMKHKGTTSCTADHALSTFSHSRETLVMEMQNSSKCPAGSLEEVRGRRSTNEATPSSTLNTRLATRLLVGKSQRGIRVADANLGVQGQIASPSPPPAIP